MSSPYALTVIHDFESYTRGDQITDDAEIARVSAGENAHHCHKVAMPPAPAPVAKKSAE